MLAIYTPTYNREKELFKLYNSLCSQKNKNFFWLIIDDGSTDQTENVVKNWMAISDFEIQYFKKENGGKHTALNMVLDLIDDKYWNICVDSDDWLIDSDVVESILEDINKFSGEEEVISLVYPRHFLGIPLKNMGESYTVEMKGPQLNNRKLGALEVSVLSRPRAYKNIRFPIFEDEKFISEGAIETPKLYLGKKMYIHKPLVEGEYLDTGLTNNVVNLWAANPKGYYYVRNLHIEYYKNINNFMGVLIPVSQMIALNILLKKPIFENIENTNTIQNIISIPMGLAYWYKRFKKN